MENEPLELDIDEEIGEVLEIDLDDEEDVFEDGDGFINLLEDD